jgi:hypothetical protein
VIWRVGELVIWRVGELESWRVGDLESSKRYRNEMVNKYVLERLRVEILRATDRNNCKFLFYESENLEDTGQYRCLIFQFSKSLTH